MIKKYHKLFKKNCPQKGGSFYVQSKVFNAKMFLMEPYPGFEEDYYKQKNMKDPLAEAEEES